MQSAEMYRPEVEIKENTAMSESQEALKDINEELQGLQKDIKKPNYDAKKGVVNFPYTWENMQYNIRFKPDKKGENLTVELRANGEKVKTEKNIILHNTNELNHFVGGMLDQQIKGPRKRVPEKGNQAFKLLEAARLLRNKDKWFEIKTEKGELKFPITMSIYWDIHTYSIKISKNGEKVSINKNRDFKRTKEYTFPNLQTAVQQSSGILENIAWDRNPELQKSINTKFNEAKKIYEILILKQ